MTKIGFQVLEFMPSLASAMSMNREGMQAVHLPGGPIALPSGAQKNGCSMIVPALLRHEARVIGFETTAPELNRFAMNMINVPKSTQKRPMSEEAHAGHNSQEAISAAQLSMLLRRRRFSIARNVRGLEQSGTY